MSSIDITAADGHVLSGYRAAPEGEPRGGIVVIQEIFGVNHHIRRVADDVAAAGYLAIAPALFDRARRGVELGYDAEGVEVGRDLAWNLPIPDTLADLVATADLLAAEVGGNGNVGAVGFCYGGMLSAALASREGRHLAASVAYYPSMAAQLLQQDQPQIPLLVHLGDLDQRVTPDDGRALAQRWADATFHRYAEAGHGFHCELRDDYHEGSADLAWQRTLDFFAANLAPGA